MLQWTPLLTTKDNSHVTCQILLQFDNKAKIWCVCVCVFERERETEPLMVIPSCFSYTLSNFFPIYIFKLSFPSIEIKVKIWVPWLFRGKTNVVWLVCRLNPSILKREWINLQAQINLNRMLLQTTCSQISHGHMMNWVCIFTTNSIMHLSNLQQGWVGNE